MSNIPVYKGQWTDWSHGAVLGNYRTFTVRETFYIIGATGAFLTIVGSSVWSIYAFFYHQVLSRQDPDIVTLQHRSISRNDSTATAAVVDAFWVYWKWKPWELRGREQLLGRSGRLTYLWPPHSRRRRARLVGLRTLLLILPALTIFFGFIVAGIFGSHIAAPAYNTNTVLVSSGLQRGTCGVTLFDTTVDALNDFDVDAWNRTHAAVSYARSCYSPPSGIVDTVSCSLFAKPSLEYDFDGVQCPFGDQNTAFEDSIGGVNNNRAAIRFQTGFLNSHHDFGINAPDSSRVQLLKEMICSPLVVDGFASTSPAHGEAGINNAMVTNYNYGSILNFADYTFQYNPASAYDNVPFEIL